MRVPLAYGAGVLVAAALPVVVIALFVAVSGELSSRYTLMVLAWGSGLAFSIAAAVAVPTLLLLHWLRAVRWLWLGIAGYVSGFTLYGYYLMSTRDDPFAMPMAPVAILVASMIGGVIGWVCASAFWLTVRSLMRPNTSFERTREG
jgi:hypothetical protein